MASIKSLKRKVNALCENLLSECYVELVFGTANEVEGSWSLVVQCEMLKAETLRKLNAKEYKKMNSKERRQHFRQLESDFYNQTIKLIERLNSMIP